MQKIRLEDDTELSVYEKQPIVSFVKNSEQISGVGFEGTLADWKREHIKRHLEHAENMCSYHRLVSPGLINSGLTNRPNGWYRTGVEGAFKGLVPEGKDVEKFAKDIEKDIENGLETHADACETVKAAFAREAHDRIICSHLFKGWNGRTARILENHLRLLLGLPILITPYEESHKYFSRIDEYRKTIFLPKLRKFYEN
jgi:hypothetical protein